MQKRAWTVSLAVILGAFSCRNLIILLRVGGKDD